MRSSTIYLLSLHSDGGYDDNVSLSFKLPVREDAGALYGDGL